MTSKKIHLSRTSCRDFVQASKMKPKFLTAPYFCDIGIFDKVAVTLKIFKQKFEKWTRSLTPVFCYSWCPLYCDIFENLGGKSFSVPIVALLSKLLIFCVRGCSIISWYHFELLQTPTRLLHIFDNAHSIS